MTKQELYKRLRPYDKKTEVKVGIIKDGEYKERDLHPQDIMISHYDGKDTIIFNPVIKDLNDKIEQENHFVITDEMKKRAEENKEGLESQFIDSKRTYGVAFCDKFYRECKGNFDTRGMDDLYIMYVGDVQGMTVVIDGDIRRDTTEEFLDYIEDLESKIINLNEKFLPLKK